MVSTWLWCLVWAAMERPTWVECGEQSRGESLSGRRKKCVGFWAGEWYNLCFKNIFLLLCGNWTKWKARGHLGHLCRSLYKRWQSFVLGCNGEYWGGLHLILESHDLDFMGLPVLRFFPPNGTYDSTAPCRTTDCCSVAQLCPTVCNPMDCSTPGFPVHHQLLELAQTYVHWVSDAIQPSHPSFLFLFSSCLQSFLASESFPMSQFFTSGWPKYWSLASVLDFPMNIQDWFPSGWTGWISLQSKGLSESSPTPQFKSINSLALSFLHSPTLTSIPDYWWLSQWCYSTISSSFAFFSSCPQSFPALGSFPMSWLCAPCGQNIAASSSASVLPMNIQGWFPLGLTGLVSLLSKGLLAAQESQIWRVDCKDTCGFLTVCGLVAYLHHFSRASINLGYIWWVNLSTLIDTTAVRVDDCFKEFCCEGSRDLAW